MFVYRLLQNRYQTYCLERRNRYKGGSLQDQNSYPGLRLVTITQKQMERAKR